MKLKKVLIIVKDIERSKKFYHDLFRTISGNPRQFNYREDGAPRSDKKH